MSLTFFYKYSVDDFCKLHDNVYNHQSKASKSIFRSTILRIERLYGKPINKLDMGFAKSVEEIYNKLTEETDYSENTKLQTISIIIKILKMCDANLGLINSYIKFHKDKTNGVQEQKRLEIQNDNSIIYNHEELQDNLVSAMDFYLNTETSYNDFIKFMILALFTLQPPTRASNFINCKLIPQKTATPPDDTTHNYLLFHGDSFTFVYNNTRKNSVLPQRLNPVVDSNLIKILTFYLDHFYIDNGTRWFIKSYGGKEVSSRVIETAVKDMGSLINDTDLTISDIRSSYLKHVYKQDNNLLDNLEIITMLGLQNLPNYLLKK